MSLNPVEGFYTFFKKKSTVPRWAIFILDLAICATALLIAFLLRFNLDFAAAYNFGFAIPLAVVTALNVAAFRFLRTSEGIIRLSSAQEGLRVVSAIFITVALLLFTNVVSHAFDWPFLIPSSVLLIYLFTSSCFLFSYRLLVKYLYNKSLKSKLQQENVIVLGKTENALILKGALEAIDQKQYKVVGFLIEEKNLWGKSIDKSKLFGYDQLKSYLHKYHIQEIFISSEDVNLELKNKVIDLCLSKNISIKVIPAIEKWADGQLRTAQLKKLKIEDLLNRPSIQLAPEHIQQFLKGKRILVTGAAGSIGSEIVQQLAGLDLELLILCDNRETGLYDLQYELQIAKKDKNILINISDIRNYDVMKGLFEAHRPHIVFHAAAYKHVPLMEMHPCQAVRNNVLGTKNVADLSVIYGVERFVFISTDKAVNPTNVMGASKRIAEMYVANLHKKMEGLKTEQFGEFMYYPAKEFPSGKTKFITTRFGNVLGSNGSVIPRFTKQIQEGGPITVTHPEITRYFMTIPEACSLVLEAGTMGHGGEIFVFDMGNPVKISDLARRMIKLSGMIPDVDIKIEYSGLRPGEKLYEELLNQEEEVMQTYHKKIMISKVNHTAERPFIEDLDRLLTLAEANKNIPLVKQMKKIVPEYKSENSQYSALDSDTKKTGKKPVETVKSSLNIVLQ